MTDWGELYAHVIAVTGWTWDYVAENVDLPRLEALNRYWAQLPPLHLMVAAYFGIKPKEQEPVIKDLQDQSLIPATPVPADAFEALLKAKGLKIDE